MKISRKAIADFAVVLASLTLGITVSACAGLTGANGNVCNNQNQCVSFSEHPGSAGAPSGSPAPASTYPTPVPQSESPSASIPGYPSPDSPAPALTPPPTPTEAVPTSSPIPQKQFDSSLHRCKQSSGVNTLLSFSVDSQLFTCMQIPPEQTDLLIQLLVLAAYDALTHQPFSPPAQYAPQAAQAQDVVTAYQ